MLTPEEGRGDGAFLAAQEKTLTLTLPEYRERE
jgi:hypothetical protein